MDKIALEQALEDISLIKQVIEKTSSTFTSFGKVFSLWGILLTIITIACFPIFYFIPNRIAQYVGYIVNIIAPILGIMLYIRTSKKSPLEGLSKKLMSIWFYIFALNIIISFLDILSIKVFKSNISATYSIFLFSIAFGMFCTYVFTNFRIPLVLSVIYLVIVLFVIYYLPVAPYSVTLKIPYIQPFLFPSTLLFLGLYLQFKGSRRNAL